MIVFGRSTATSGILKSLGAFQPPARDGHLSGLRPHASGIVGCGLGTALGLWFTHNINAIEMKADRRSPASDSLPARTVYYFKDIPTNIDPLSVALVNLGAG